MNRVFLYFFYFSVMFRDNYTLNNFFISVSDEASFFSTIILSNAEHELRYYVIYITKKCSFKRMSYFKELS